MSDSRLRVAIVADFAEEGWPSMDLVANSLFDRLHAEHADEIDPVLMRPHFRRRFTRTANTTNMRHSYSKAAFNADRLLNRFVDYPRLLKRVHRDFDVFHIIDHSYAHLATSVPAHRAIVTCHDLDAFHSLLASPVTIRSGVIKMLANRALRGLQAAAMVACDSDATRGALLDHRLVAMDRARTIPNGVAPIFSARAEAQPDAEVRRILGSVSVDAPELLHVGSTIPRKRIDLLLRAFAGIRKTCPRARLLRAGGPFTAQQAALARELKVDGETIVLPFLEPAILAAVYRRATLVLVTSEQEGFGLPLIEAMACGTPVIASDLPVLREVGGDALEFVRIEDVPAWVSMALRLIDERANDSDRWNARRAAGLRQAAKFSWSEYALGYIKAYRHILSA